MWLVEPALLRPGRAHSGRISAIHSLSRSATVLEASRSNFHPLRLACDTATLLKASFQDFLDGDFPVLGK